MGRQFVRILGNRSPARKLAVLLLVGVSMVGCSRSDAAVQEELQKQLAADSQIAGAHLTVTVNQGVTLIKGETQTTAQQQRAVDIARAVKGVTQIQTEIRLSDAGLTEEVKKAVAADASVNQVPLRIEVKDAQVKLYSDQTNADQRAKLRDIAGGVPGVAGVEDNMK